VYELRSSNRFHMEKHMAARGKEPGSSDPLEKEDDKAQGKTSKSREESMSESGQDAFSAKNVVRKPDASPQGDGTSDPSDMTYVGRAGEQFSSTSGTTSLGGESRDADEKTGAGGVEGDRDNR
jgi:hypothetical protein